MMVMSSKKRAWEHLKNEKVTPSGMNELECGKSRFYQ